MPAFNNLNSLIKHLNERVIKNALGNEVAEKVRDIEQRKIDKTVYSGYRPSTSDGEPWVYKRRRDNGGLRDRKNMIADVQVTSDGVKLSVENVTTGSQDNFKIADLIEYGDNTNGKEYAYKRNRDGTADQYLRSRPFTKNTIEELKRTGEHIDALIDGLKKQGIDVKKK
ncbi:hypothetical protein NST17_19820 [Caldifermentibacillus hisashii]|uniref:HK97 gp10 family phage protein n=1 Tax=Caldifermentibacillus hisashii TaxID=996558 RepID=A0ABU9K3L5_9BACI